MSAVVVLTASLAVGTLLGLTPARQSVTLVEAPDASLQVLDSDSLLDVNTASTEELMLLPGIGPVKAQAIVEYRMRHGRFSSLADLKKVRGIGPVTVRRIGGLAEAAAGDD